MEIITEAERALIPPLFDIVRGGDFEVIQKVIADRLGVLRKNSSPELPASYLDILLASAAEASNIPAMEILIRFGADIHADSSKESDGVINRVMYDDRIDVVRWLLDHGAVTSRIVNGSATSASLLHAAIHGAIECARLLVERGAPVNGVAANGLTALDFARLYGHADLAAFLESRGGKTGRDVRGLPPPAEPETFAAFLAGSCEPEPLVLREVVPTDFPVAIHRARQGGRTVLVTEGMSARPNPVPADDAACRWTELAVLLPADWPGGEAMLADPRYAWPVELLRRLARRPVPAGGYRSWYVIPNGDPARPVAPDTRQDHLLVEDASGTFWVWKHPAGKEVRVQTVFPLYPEEAARSATPAGAADVYNRLEARGPRVYDPVRETVD